MRYAIAPLIKHRAEPIEISEAEYRSIARAKDGLITIIGIEQKFDILLENTHRSNEKLWPLSVV
jgi:tricorn protease-like protein